VKCLCVWVMNRGGCAPLFIQEVRPKLGTSTGEKRCQPKFAPSFPALAFRHGGVSEAAAGSEPGLHRPPQGAGRPKFGLVRAGLSRAAPWPIMACSPVGASTHFCPNPACWSSSWQSAILVLCFHYFFGVSVAFSTFIPATHVFYKYK
jgi:hypothetical protein